MMIDRLKFRGKTVKPFGNIAAGIWVVGTDSKDHIDNWTGWVCSLAEFFKWVEAGEINPATVSQWTGLKDSKGVDVYEGDIVRIVSEMEDAAGEQVVKWHDEGGYFAEIFDGGDYVPMLGADDYTVTVIGNIHDKEQV